MEIPPEWADLDLSDPSDVTDTELLNEFSFPAEAHCPENLNVISLPISDNVVIAKTSQNLLCERSIENGINLHFQSEGQISLNNGFQIACGATLNATIAACPN